MKIAYVSREFGSITGGGIGTYITNVTHYMSQRQHEIYLVTDCFNDTNRHYLPPNVTLIPTQPALPNRQGCYLTWLQEYSDRVYQTLKNLNQRIQLDVIEFAEYNAEGFITIRAKKLLNQFATTKLVVKLHTPNSILRDINEENFRNYDAEIDIYAEDYCVKNADLVLSPSNSLVDYYQHRLGTRSKTHRSPYPLELTNTNQSRIFNDTQIHRVVFAGTVQVRKGVDFFIEAAQLVLAKEPNFKFEIYGKDTDSAPFCRSYVEYLQKRIPEHWKNNIVFKGCASYTQIVEIFHNSCFCVFPSRWENWPNVCLEAMSLGCVVIGSKHGGMSEMIEHGVSGFLIDPYKPEEIAHTILDNYRNISYLKQISTTAQESIKKWCDPELACQQIESCYQIEIAPKTWIVNQKPKVSAIVPLYNQGQSIQETIDSIRKSTYKNVEIVVVNDGSTDRYTNQVFEQLVDVVKVDKLNGGLSSARNAGIAASSGEFILPLDADDKIHENFIADGVNCLQSDRELDYIGCWSQYFEMSSETWMPIGFIPSVSFLRNTINSCSAIFRRSVFDKAGYYDEEMISYEDWEFYLRLHLQGFQGDIIPETYLHYRVKSQSSSMLQGTGIPKSKVITQYILKKHERSLNKETFSLISQLLIDLWKREEIDKCNADSWYRGEIARLEDRICGLEATEARLAQRIKAMESSKFWRSRLFWFNLKRKLGLSQEEP